MKKLLSLLSSVVLAAVGATTVVACSAPTTNIKVDLKDSANSSFTPNGDNYTFKDNGKDATYTKSELNAAMDGNSYVSLFDQQFPAAMNFDTLNMSLLNVLNFNPSLVVKTQQNHKQLRDFRDAFLGRDDDSVSTADGQNIRSVDGNKFNSIDDNNFYNNFDETNINSLTGLLSIYKYGKANGDGSTLTGAGSKSAYEAAKKLFDTGSNKDAANELMSEFANSKKNPAFTAISYDMPLTIYHSQSQLIQQGFNTTDGKSNGQLTLGDISKYKDNNPGVADDKDYDSKGTDATKNLINNQQNGDPFAAIIIDPDSGAHKDKQDFVINSKTLVDQTKNKKEDESKVLSERFTNDESNVSYFVNKDGDSDYSLNWNFGEYFVKPVKSNVGITYTYDTDVDLNNADKKAKDNQEFKISLKLNNLAEIFSPVMSAPTGPSLDSTTYNDKDKTLSLKFSGVDFTKDNKDLLKDNGLTVTGVTGDPTPSGTDTLVYKSDSPSAGTIQFSINKDKDASSKTKVTYNYDATANKGVTKFSTHQLVWLFRGYKFIDYENIENNKAVVMDPTFVDKGSNNGPVRSPELTAEINHNLRDMNNTDWDISIVKDSKD